KSSRSSCHRSAFMAGFLSDFIHPFFCHDLAQPFIIASDTYFESVVSTTWHGSFKALSAYITAQSSMRLFVVIGSAPLISFLNSLYMSIAAQTPAPGLTEHAPSV